MNYADIIVTVARTLELNVEDVRYSRVLRHREARYICIYLIREKTYQKINQVITWNMIGKLFNRNHSTAIASYNRCIEFAKVDKEFCNKLLLCRESLYY